MNDTFLKNTARDAVASQLALDCLIKLRSVVLITGLTISGIILSGTFAPVQAVGILLTSKAGYTGSGLDLSAYTGKGYNLTAGPAPIPEGITFTSTREDPVIGQGDYGLSVLGQGSYGLSDNGDLGGSAVYAGLVPRLDPGLGVGATYMTFSFASAVSSFGAFMNYAPVIRNISIFIIDNPTISTYDSSNNLLSTFNLAALAPISTPGGFNQLAFRGIDEGSAIISSFRISGLYVVAAGSANGLAAPTPTSVPEPFTIVGTLIGSTVALRIRKKLKAIAK